ncbi:cation:proton antiporter [Kibdelosporangium persicum]|uniref:Integral membrane ion antiporter n=1 Tax=Kibdelosporangium persicum TaxID=2698649 RepID=A0ABX2EV69_9PSEU|nr:cation:proton antiporter [Kibdelosporangium persicum]NRN62857.1 Integral membrane ion antiporter [Kibdelosporangium persicum]
MSFASAPAPVASHQLLIFLLQLVLLLVLAFALGRLAERVNLPAIVGELFAGVLLGPSLLGFVAPAVSNWLLPADAEQARMLDGASQIGVLLLVGVTGCYLDLGLIRRKRGTAAKISIAGLVIPLGFGIGLGALLPASLIPDTTTRWVFAMFLGVAMCVTAIPVIAKTLSDMRFLHRDVGQLTLAAGLIDDAVGWFLLSVISAIATVGVTMGYISLSILYLIGFVAFAFLVGRPLVGRLMAFAERFSGPGATIALTVIVIMSGAAITQAIGLEAIFGAFVAGIVIGSARTAGQAKLAPLHTVVQWVLAPLFLASAGLRMDLTALADAGVALAALAILVIAILGKFTGAYLGARMSRLSHWEGLAIGAGMNARGIVEVVIATVGLRLGVLDVGMYTAIVLVAVVTSLMGPPVMRMAMSRVVQTDVEARRKALHDRWTEPPGEQPKAA